MEVKFFVLCTKEICLHGKTAFRRGHVYIAHVENSYYRFISETDSPEVFPKDFFSEHFQEMFPVMEKM